MALLRVYIGTQMFMDQSTLGRSMLSKFMTETTFCLLVQLFRYLTFVQLPLFGTVMVS